MDGPSEARCRAINCPRCRIVTAASGLELLSDGFWSCFERCRRLERRPAAGAVEGTGLKLRKPFKPISNITTEDGAPRLAPTSGWKEGRSQQGRPAELGQA